jgi:hypothetical protein
MMKRIAEFRLFRAHGAGQWFAVAVAVGLLLLAAPASAQSWLVLSSDCDLRPASVTLSDHSLFEAQQGGAYAVYASGLAAALPKGCDIDAVDVLSDTRVVFSLDCDIDLSSTIHADEDLLVWNGATIASFWDGSANGLPPGADINAVQVAVESPLTLDISLDADTALPPIPGVVADEDVVRWSSGMGWWPWIEFDGSLNDVPPECDLDGLHRMSNGDFLLTFDSAWTLYGVEVDDGDVARFDWWGLDSVHFRASDWAWPEGMDANALYLLGQSRAMRWTRYR